MKSSVVGLVDGRSVGVESRKAADEEWTLCQGVSGPWHVARGGSGRVSGEGTGLTGKDGGRRSAAAVRESSSGGLSCRKVASLAGD